MTKDPEPSDDAAARRQLRATLEILRTISRSRDDEMPVFDVILDSATRLCDAPLAFLSIVNEDSETLSIPAHRGARADMAGIWDGMRDPLADSDLVSAHAIRNREIIHVDDLANDPDFGMGDDRRAELVELEQVRTYLVVPLIRGDRTLGTLNLYRREVRPFRPEQIDLLKTLAAQAVIAIDNVRQFREVQTRLDRERASARVLDVISRSRTDTGPVFDAILNSAADLCAAPHALLLLPDAAGTHLELAASNTAESKFVDSLRETPHDLSNRKSAASLTFESGKTRHVLDVRALFSDEDRAPQLSFAAEIEGMRTVLLVPLISGSQTIGVISVYKLEVAPFSADEIALVESFAAQAVIAIENVRQFREVQERLARETATKDILGVISQSRDDDTLVFDLILSSAGRLCNASTAMLQLTEDGVSFTQKSIWAERVQGDYPNETTFTPAPDMAVPLSVREKRTVQIADLADDDLYRSGNPVRVRMVDEEGIRTFMSVPLINGDKAIGSITLSRRIVKPFQDADVALVESFAAQAVIAIENVRQFREVQERLEREAASREILQVISTSRDDSAPVFDVILKNAAYLSGAPLANLCLLNAERSHWHLAAHFGDGLRHLTPGKSITALDNNLVPAVAMREARVVHVEDLTDTDLYRQGDPGRVAMVDVEGMRTILCVPFLSGDRAIGCITLFRREVKAFTSDEIALVETFAAQAVIAIENVRQFREVQDRLEREAASSEILTVISQSRDDEMPVFDAILENALRLCAADMAVVNTVNEARTEVGYATGINSMGPRFQPGYKSWPIDSPQFVCRAIFENQTFHTPDLMDTELYRSGDVTRRNLVDNEGMRTQLVLPLVQGDQAIACFSLYRKKMQPFSDTEIALLETFAAQAVIAIENVRQFREVQNRLLREAATSNVLNVIAQSRDDAQPVFDAIHDNVSRLCDASFSGLFLRGDGDGTLNLVSHRGGDPDYVAMSRADWPISDQSAQCRAVQHKKVVHVRDLADTEAYRAGHEATVRAVEVAGIRTFLAVPLMQGEMAIGSIGTYRCEHRPFSPDEVTLLETFAAQAVIAIESVRQFREVQERLEREQASRQILGVISESRDDEAPVFDVILRNAAELCDAPVAWLMLASSDRETFTFTAVHGDDLQAMRIGEQFDLNSSYRIAQTIREARTTEIPDLADTDEYRAGEPVYLKLVDDEGLRTRINVPLIRGGIAIGCIVLSRPEVRRFSPDEITLVETFAAQAVIGIENVRQFREVQERLEREKASGEVLEIISQSRDDDLPVFRTITEAVARLCNAPLAYICVLNSERTHVTIPAHVGARPDFAARLDRFSEPVESNWLFAVEATIERKVIRIDDLAQTDLYREGNEYRIFMVDEEGMRSVLVVPLVSGPDGVGCIVLYRREVAPFSDAELELVRSFAAQAVIAIQNVRQYRALETLNTELETRVEDQVGEIERMGRLKRFLSPAVADAVVSSGDEKLLKSHRALIAVLFCDIRGFTAFCESAEPEETIEVLQTYHEEMGKLIAEHGAGVDTRSGDGIMVIFNDPLPCEDPAGSAMKLAFAMRARMAELCKGWKRLGHRLGFGVGLSLGFATVGMVGAAGRFEYTASGTAVNLASRLCDQASDGEILLAPRAYTAVEDDIEAEVVGEMEFKGMRAPIEVVRALKRIS